MGGIDADDADARVRLAAELLALQGAVGLSLKELERVTHASDSSLSRYFAGRSVPPWSVVEALCRVAGREPERLRGAWAAARRTRMGGRGRGEVQAGRGGFGGGVRYRSEAGANRAGKKEQAERRSEAGRSVAGAEAGAEQSEQAENEQAETEQAGTAQTETGPKAVLAPYNNLPRAASAFVGRRSEIAALLAEPGLWVVDGMAGVGKTALAVHAARALAERTGGDVLYLHMHGHTTGRAPLTPEAGLAALLHAVGIQDAPEDLDLRSALWRSQAARRTMVIVLDDAFDAAQVAPLLPGNPGAAVLVTGRRRLLTLAGARALSLDVPPLAECRELFDTVAGPERRAVEPEGVDEVIRLCGHLPLAVQLCAARLHHRPAWSAAFLARRLREEGRRLRELAADDSGVAAALSLSVAHLSEPMRPAFAVLGSVPGERFDAYAAAALWDVPVPEAEDMLQELVDAHLVDEPAAGRYRLHDLTRDYARSLDEPGREAAERRLVDDLLAASGHAYLTFDDFSAKTGVVILPEVPAERVRTFADRPEAGDWFEEHAGILIHLAQQIDDHRSIDLLRNTARYLWLRGRGCELVEMASAALEVARRIGTVEDRAWTLQIAGTGYAASRRPAEAIEYFETALTLAVGPSRGFLLNALAVTASQQWRLEEAHRWGDEAVRFFRSASHAQGIGLALANRSEIETRRGWFACALVSGRESLMWFEEADYPAGRSTALLMIGDALWHVGRLDEAMQFYQNAYEAAQSLRYYENTADALRGLAVTHRAQGDFAKALAYHDRVDEAVAQAGAMHPDHAEFLVERARTELAAGRVRQAETSAWRAQELARSSRNPFEEGRAAALLAASAGRRRDARAAELAAEAEELRVRLGLEGWGLEECPPIPPLQPHPVFIPKPWTGNPDPSGS